VEVTTRTQGGFRIEIQTDDGEIVEHLAGIDDYRGAMAIYWAAVER
jgi:hypothetical protein